MVLKLYVVAEFPFVISVFVLAGSKHGGVLVNSRFQPNYACALTNTYPHLYMWTYFRLVYYQSLNYHTVKECVSGICVVILYYFKCFFGIKFENNNLRDE